MKQIYYRKNADSAVSPVVGVMLMLVVTIIIAAVVSAFAGGLGSTQQKAPTASMEFRISNGGDSGRSFIHWKVLDVSEPISTKDVKIVTSWKTANGTSGGATVLPTGLNVHNYQNRADPSTYRTYNAPAGMGPSINWSQNYPQNYPDSWFGNYTLAPGVGSTAYASCYGRTGQVTTNRFHYTTDVSCAITESDADPVIAFLGRGWEDLREGDIVNVKFIHIPSGKTFIDQKVSVEQPWTPGVGM
jgi:FlaG/FlaF family flagellin (archaellin)